jgi:AmpD protein
LTLLKNQPLWYKGWYRFARSIVSPHYDERPTPLLIDVLVIHAISLPPGVYETPYVEALFTNTLDFNLHPCFQSIRHLRVSTHFYIDRSGVLKQFVSCDQRAWHAGVSQFQGRKHCNDFSIGIELEGLPHEEFTALQYETLGCVATAIQQYYPIRYVVGHQDIAAIRKIDPGDGFDWGYLKRLGFVMGRSG